MRVFKNFDTNEIWTEDEIRETYESESILVEAYPTFDEYVDFLLDLGKKFEGGIVEIESQSTRKDLVEKFDRVFDLVDPFGYGSLTDEEKSLAFDLLESDPYEVIDQLLDFIEQDYI